MGATIGNTAFVNILEVNWSFTLENNGSIVVVVWMTDSSGAPSSSFADGIPMPLLASVVDGAKRRTYLWAAEGCSQGNITISGICPNTNHGVIAISVVDSSMDVPGDKDTAKGIATSAATSISSTAGSIIISGICVDDNIPGGLTESGTQVFDADLGTTTNRGGVQYESGDGGVVAPSYSWSTSKSHAMVSVEFLCTLFPVSISMDELTLASSSPNIYPRMPVIMDPLTLTASPQMLIPSLPLADPAKMRNYRRARSVGPVTVYE